MPAAVVTRRIPEGTGSIYSLGSFADDADEDDAATAKAEEETEDLDDADVNVGAATGADAVVGISSLIKSPHTLAIAGSIAGSPEDTPPVVLRRPPAGAMPYVYRLVCKATMRKEIIDYESIIRMKKR